MPIQIPTRESEDGLHRTSLERLINMLDDNYDDPMVVLLEMARGTPIKYLGSIYRLQEFGTNERLPDPLKW